MELDVLELLGIAAGLIAATLFIRHTHGPLVADIATVAVAVGPFLLRAMRRKLGVRR